MDSKSNLITRVAGHLGWMHSAAVRRVKNRELAQDVVQAAVILYWRKQPHMEGEAQLLAWLFRAVRYASANALRMRKRRKMHEREAAMMRPGHADADTRLDTHDELESAMDSLGEKDRQAILLRFYRGQSLAEVAASLGIPEDAARKRVTRAVDRLQRHLASHDVAVTTAVLPELLKQIGGPVPAELCAWLASFNGSAGAGAMALATKVSSTLWWVPVKIAASIVVGTALAAGGIATLAAAVGPTTKPAPDGAPSPVVAGRPVGEYYVGGGPENYKGRPFHVGAFSLSGRRLTLTQAMANAGVDIGNNPNLYVHLLRERPRGETEIPLFLVSGFWDLPLEPNDQIILRSDSRESVEKPKIVLPDNPATQPIHPSRVEMFDILGEVPMPGRYFTTVDGAAITITGALRHAKVDVALNRDRIIQVHRGRQSLAKGLPTKPALVHRIAELLDSPELDVKLEARDLVVVPRSQKQEAQHAGKETYYVTGVARSGCYSGLRPLTWRQALASAGYVTADGEYVLLPRGGTIYRLADVEEYAEEAFVVEDGDVLAVVKSLGRPAEVAQRIREARLAVSQNRLADAVRLVDEILVLDPANDYANAVRPLLIDRRDLEQAK